jgi:hypothetical protein
MYAAADVCDSCLCRRGKAQQKHYTIFVADVDANVADQFIPKLSAESRAWQWVSWADVLAAAAAGAKNKNNALQLHPVVAVLASQHVNEVRSATQACPAAGPAASSGRGL